MTKQIINAAPMDYLTGIRDDSTRKLVLDPVKVPTHLVKAYIYAKKGPLETKIAVGDSLINYYGSESFDSQKKWYNHQTELVTTVNEFGNSLSIQRLKPDDAPPPATIRLSLDVLPTTVQSYLRNVDKTFQLDANGVKIPDTNTVPGYKIKWVVSEVNVDPVTGQQLVGGGVQTAGDQVDTITGTVSQRYPIMDFVVSHFGSYGNDLGIRIWTDTVNSVNAINPNITIKTKAFPFRIACVSRSSPTSNPLIFETQAAEQSLLACLKPNTIFDDTNSQMYLPDIFVNAYQTVNVPNFPDTYGPFGQVYLYQSKIDEVLELVYNAEKGFANITNDLSLTPNPEEKYLMNIFCGYDSHGVPYESLIIDATTTNDVFLTSATNILAKGGGDGTMNNESFALLVAQEIAKYGNENSEVQDIAKNPEAFFYDTGFPLEVKKKLPAFISIRKDTFLFLSTRVFGDPILTGSEESSLAMVLKAAAQLYPESETYGTPACRFAIIGRSGRWLKTTSNVHRALTLEVAMKMARMMGAGNGEWKTKYSFDGGDYAKIENFAEINVTFTPAKVKNKDWVNGLNWVEYFDHVRLYFPALKTGYTDDTSVLNSVIFTAVCVEVTKVGARARRQYSGTTQYTDEQLKEVINGFITKNTNGRFGTNFVVVPNTIVTKSDEARGYSWTSEISVYGPNMKTVQTLTVVSKRISDLS